MEVGQGPNWGCSAKEKKRYIEPFLRRKEILSFSRKFSPVVYPECSVLCSQESLCGPYPDQTNLFHILTFYFSKGHWNVVLPYISRSPFTWIQIHRNKFSYSESSVWRNTYLVRQCTVLKHWGNYTFTSFIILLCTKYLYGQPDSRHKRRFFSLSLYSDRNLDQPSTLFKR
jgi:hypothetical protein